MIRQYFVYFIKFIQIVLLSVSIPMLLFPVAAIVIYVKSQYDLTLRFSFINASYPWSLLENTTQFFMFAGIVFFVGLVIFILSYVLKKIVVKVRG